MLQLITIDFLTIYLTYLLILAIKQRKHCRTVIVTALVVVHLLLLSNAPDWNEGSMSSAVYILPFFKSASDTFYALILFSAILLLTPLMIYGFLLVGFSHLLCAIAKRSG
ncbi:hypothetical protein [Nitratifractor sp.]